MSVSSATGRLAADYVERFPESCELHLRARTCLGGDAAHDSWRFDPFPVSFERADGPCKWDADGNPYIDFWMGHGALLFGHGFPLVIDAVAQQLSRGTHFGGAHRLQVEWAEEICALIASAERVRFTSSGTEATLLAMRIARAATGRQTVARVDGHFHGWHDEALAGSVAHGSGIHPGIEDRAIIVPLDLDVIAEMLAEVAPAALILEPGGGGAGALPWSVEELRTLRTLTAAHGTLLIFDEVISAFRYAPGGVQALSGVTPDLTTLAKILAGGLPGAAVCGRAEVMAVLGRGTVNARAPHSGTFNASPLSAAAGIATLREAADGSAQAAAERATRLFVDGVNRAAARRGADLALFHQSSIFHIAIGARARGGSPEPSPLVFALHREHRADYVALRRALLIEGIDTHLVHGWVSAVHREEIIDEAIAAFDRALARLASGNEAPAVFPEGGS